MATIRVGARASPLSLVQVEEVLHELPHDIDFDLITIQTIGDKQQDVSLRGLEKTDFFTRELDNMLLTNQCDIAIHSAKDLPDPIRDGLTIAAITRGVASFDSLVLKPEETIDTLPSGAVIATSSERREEAVRLLRHDLSFCDLRGTIEQRLKQLNDGKVDGVVLAEAALIRLKLTHLNRVKLPGDTTPLQGKLAILTRTNHQEMVQIFSPLDCRCEVFIPG